MLKGNNYICYLKNLTMKFNQFLLSLVANFIINISFAQTNLINENFDSGDLNGWSVLDADMANPFNDSIVMQLPQAFHLVADYDSLNDGDLVMAATSWFDDTVSANNFLISPVINFHSNGNYLNFQAMSVDGSHPDGLQIFYAYDISNTNTLMENPVLFDTIAVPNISNNYQISLNEIPLDTNFYIVFRHYATNQYILTLDNIRVITNDATAINNNLNSYISIYPNPTEGSINISASNYNQSASIYSSVGKKLWSGRLKPSINLNFTSGYYFLNCDNTSFPFIIK